MAENDPQQHGWQSWFRERRLAHVLFVYAGASWAVLEVTDVFIDKLGLPSWFFPAALVLLLIGLVVVTVTAIVQQGARRTQGVQAARPLAPPQPTPLRLLTWPRAILGGVLAFGALAAVGTVWVLTRVAGDEAVVSSPNAVAVLPFRTTGASLDVWREGLMDVLAANLDGVGEFSAVDKRTVLSRWQGRIGDVDAPAEDAIDLARRLGATWAIYGQAVELGGQVRLDTRFHATATGEQAASSSVVGRPDSILPLIEAVTLELLRGLGAEQGTGAGR